MKISTSHAVLLLALSSCAADSPVIDASNSATDYEELDTATVVAAPKPVAGSYHPDDRDKIERGEYMIQLLGCGSCHTDGAFDGAPNLERALAGSNTGIAFTSPLGDKYPGVVYPPNITPDEATGIGLWSDMQIANAIRAGIGRHGERRLAVMPWQGFSRLTDDDVDAMVAYLRSIKPIKNKVPKEVAPGYHASHPFVYFGVYRSRP